MITIIEPKFIEVLDGLWYEIETGKPYTSKVRGYNVWHNDDNISLRPLLHKINFGYYRVRVGNKKELWHRIVWNYFKGNIPFGFEVDHINGLRDDNRIINLQLLTHQQNLSKKVIGGIKQKYN